MKKQITLLAILLASMLLAGCQFVPALTFDVVRGSGHVISEARSVNEFDAVSLSGLGDLTITQDEKESLTVEAEDNLLPLITTQVRNGTLYIGTDQKDWRTPIAPTKPIRFDLHVKDLTTLDISGAGKIQSANLKSDRLNVNISGAGNIKLDQVEANEMTTTVSGAGNLDVAGHVARQVAFLSGVGNYQAAGLNSDNARVDLSGAGGATLWANNTLDVSISGAGSVKYYGSPHVSQRVAGVGSVRKLGDK